ncbi:MAG: 50S ribosomal protein L29 [Deltaproteobacteria bacterium]|jgi:large subunit ribosomal protein L29|nr:50S ribosomal protein L29 [Deltaproteobacteria bacterium]MBW2476365.1 50S ribosomal protein L29 [Deltaproteobacteria bacterium]MBW2504511.1 50S ribosomal protein L29 [Deltaproteobacteria bacterium]MBW2520610.1 50S ribosomal protein L29 [Deltaproteobacteria bacterium]
MNANELRDKTVEELNKQILELNQELFNLKFQLHTGHLENTARIGQVRKEIARVNTVIQQKNS